MNARKQNTLIDPIHSFPEVENICYNLAWKFVQKYPQLSFDEAKSQAYWGFMRATMFFDRKRKNVQFSTWVYQCVWWNLKNLVMERSGDQLVHALEVQEEICGEAPPHHSPCLEALEDLSHDAKEIVAMLLESPREVLEQAGTPKQLLAKVKRYLRDQGRCREKLEMAEEEITLKLRAFWRGEELMEGAAV